MLCTTVRFAIFPTYLSVVCIDIANNIGTKVYLSSTGQYWSGYNLNTRIILDRSQATKSGLSTGTIYFQTSDTNNLGASTFQNICAMNTNGMNSGGIVGILIHCQ